MASRTLPLSDGVCCGSYHGVQGAGNRDLCAVATQGVCKRNRAGLAGGLLLDVASVFTLVTGRWKVAAKRGTDIRFRFKNIDR